MTAEELLAQVNAKIDGFLPGSRLVYTRTIDGTVDTTTINFVAASGGSINTWEFDDYNEAESLVSGIDIGIDVGRHGL